jgi:formylglycine-generating enzyme required for sulfatase activity
MLSSNMEAVLQTVVPPGMVMVQGGVLPQSSELSGQRVATFHIGRYEVTWDEWQEVRAWAVNNGYTDLAAAGAGSAGNHPVRDVSWYDVIKWCNAKSEKEMLTAVYSVNGTTYRTGQADPSYQLDAKGYRLPTEREWEWAARGGVLSKGYTYSGSNNLDEVGWYAENSLNAPVIIENGRGTWPIGQKSANELGIFEMSGNVFEWCWDLDPSLNRYLRGGGWHFYGADACRVKDRSIARRWETINTYSGLRIAKNLGF